MLAPCEWRGTLVVLAFWNLDSRLDDYSLDAIGILLVVRDGEDVFEFLDGKVDFDFGEVALDEVVFGFGVEFAVEPAEGFDGAGGEAGADHVVDLLGHVGEGGRRHLGHCRGGFGGSGRRVGSDVVIVKQG